MSLSNMKFNPAALTSDALEKVRGGAQLPAGKQFLLPGQLHVARQATTISTILGSCVALCLWDTRTRVGGMNHYLLPEGEKDATNRLRYGNVANPELLKKMLEAGGQVRNLQARIYGGASTFPSGNTERSLGSRNVDLAIEFLRQCGIPLLQKDVSGIRGRKLIFNTANGSVELKNFEE